MTAARATRRTAKAAPRRRRSMRGAALPTPLPSPPIVVVANRQRDQALVPEVVAETACLVLGRVGRDAELGIHLVSAKEMTRLNRDYLGHEGSTDVITFDHGSGPDRLHGELFVCVADAVTQAGEFGTTWPEEVARYVIHGILHLCGHDDLQPDARRAMKREENRLVRWLAQVLPPAGIARVAMPRRKNRRRHG